MCGCTGKINTWLNMAPCDRAAAGTNPHRATAHNAVTLGGIFEGLYVQRMEKQLQECRAYTKKKKRTKLLNYADRPKNCHIKPRSNFWTKQRQGEEDVQTIRTGAETINRTTD